MIDNMKTVNLQISESAYRDFERLGKDEQRDPADLMREALERYRTERMAADAPQKRQSILNRPPHDPGAILKPWATRAELLEDYFDRD